MMRRSTQYEDTDGGTQGMIQFAAAIDISWEILNIQGKDECHGDLGILPQKRNAPEAQDLHIF